LHAHFGDNLNTWKKSNFSVKITTIDSHHYFWNSNNPHTARNLYYDLLDESNLDAYQEAKKIKCEETQEINRGFAWAIKNSYGPLANQYSRQRCDRFLSFCSRHADRAESDDAWFKRMSRENAQQQACKNHNLEPARKLCNEGLVSTKTFSAWCRFENRAATPTPPPAKEEYESDYSSQSEDEL